MSFPFFFARPKALVRSIALLSLTACAFSTVHAQSYLSALGGPGGGQFKAPCISGGMLNGFELRAGDDVDAIRPVCIAATGPIFLPYRYTAPLTADSGLVGDPNNLFAPQHVAQGWFGGVGGRIQQLLCPSSAPIVIGIDVSAEGIDTVTVNNIHLFCGVQSANQTPTADPQNVFDAPTAKPSAGALGLSVNRPQRVSGSERCPAGQVAVGMHGRAGVWLDALGLICAAPPPWPFPPESDGKPAVALGRVQAPAPASPAQTMGDEPPICAIARSARARNAPTATSLETQCAAAGGNFADRAISQAPSNIRARNSLAVSRVGIAAPQSAGAPPVAANPAPDAPRMPGDRLLQGETFAPPLFDDGAQLWACADAAQGAHGTACRGTKAGREFCRMRGHSGALQHHRDGSSAVKVGSARDRSPIRTTKGEVCVAADCAVVSELECAP